MDRWLLLAAIAALLVCQRTEADNERDPRFTGDPQIDWEFDPNLPRELQGYNMTGFPFLSRPPNKMKFSCRDRIDGFYSNIEYKCQVYHHCLYGIRQDFLCANYTAFDMSTFICQFVNVVDCEGSDKFVYRNEPLYKFTTTVEPRRKRPFQRRPAEEYDYDYEDYYYDYPAYDEPEATTTTTTTTTTTRRPVRRRPGVRRRRPGLAGAGGRRRPQQTQRRRPQPPVYDYDYVDDYYTDEAVPAVETVELQKSAAAAAAPEASTDLTYADYDYVDKPAPTQAPVRQQTRRGRPGGRPGVRQGGRVGGRRRPAPARAQAAPELTAASPISDPVAVRRPPPAAAVPVEEAIENEVLDSAPRRGRPGRPGRRRPAAGGRRGSLVVRRPAAAAAPPAAVEETAPPAAAAPEQDPAPTRGRRPAAPEQDPAPARGRRPAAPEQDPAPARGRRPAAPEQDPAPARGRRPAAGGGRPGLRPRQRQRQPAPTPDYYYDYVDIESASATAAEAPAEEAALYEDEVPLRQPARRRGAVGGGRGVRRGGGRGRVGGRRRPAPQT